VVLGRKCGLTLERCWFKGTQLPNAESVLNIPPPRGWNIENNTHETGSQQQLTALQLARMSFVSQPSNCAQCRRRAHTISSFMTVYLLIQLFLTTALAFIFPHRWLKRRIVFELTNSMMRCSTNLPFMSRHFNITSLS
jgi:hypothetical protein